MVFDIERGGSVFFGLEKMYLNFNLVNLIGLASLNTVWIYKYDLKNDHNIPVLVLSCPRTEKN